MKTMALSEYGPNSAFALTELPKPTADTGHVIVRVQATSINTIDMMIRSMGTDLGLPPLHLLFWAWILPARLKKSARV